MPLIRLKKKAGAATALIDLEWISADTVGSAIAGESATLAALRTPGEASAFFRYKRAEGSLERVDKEAWLAEESSVWTMADDCMRAKPDRYWYRLDAASGHFKSQRTSPEQFLLDNGLHGYRLRSTGEHGRIAVTSTVGRSVREGSWPSVSQTVVGPFLLDIFDRDTGLLQCGPIELNLSDGATYLQMYWSEDQELVVLVTSSDELVLHIADRIVLCKGE